MSTALRQFPPVIRKRNSNGHVRRQVYRGRWLYALLLPGLLYFVLYKYLPMFGLVVAFQDYKPFFGIFGSKWVGWKHFARLFGDPDFWTLFSNTMIIAFYNMVFYFPLTIVMALLLNEVRHEWFKRAAQTVTYLPHFLSWVVVASITYKFLSIEGGVVNMLLRLLGREPVEFMLEKQYFRTMIVAQAIWRDMGWGAIIFLAALAGVDVQLYESAIVEGAGRFQRLWYITLPSIQSTIIIILILRLGRFLDLGFEQIYLMLNAMNREVGEIFDTYIYEIGIRNSQYSYSTAVGLFKSIVGLFLVFDSNFFAKKLGEEGLY